MQLPEVVRERLQSEFRFAADRMATTPDLAGKLYFFSVVFGETNRAMNVEWDAELALLHLVAVGAHGEITGRLSQENALGLGLSGVPDGLPDALTSVTAELATLFEQPQQDSVELHGLLSRLAEIAYTATGNGYYLYLKGAVTV